MDVPLLQHHLLQRLSFCHWNAFAPLSKSVGYLIRDLCLVYIEKSHNSIIKRKITQLKNGQRIWKDVSPKKVYKWPVSTLLVIREMQIKPPMRCHFIPSRMDIIKETDNNNLKIWRNWSPHTLLVRMWNGLATLENSLVVPQKVKHRATIWPRNSTPRYIPKRNENS